MTHTNTNLDNILYTVTMVFYTASRPYKKNNSITFNDLTYQEVINSRDFFDARSKNRGLDYFQAFEQPK